MSVEAITWALAQRVERSSAKFVLVAMANCANNDGSCWPSMGYLCEATEQDRKTVTENIRRLKEAGLIEPTDERRGATGQVIVYRINTTKNGPVKEAQKRNSTEIGTVPKTDDKTPENGHEEAQKRTERPPKTGHGTVRNPKEPSENRKALVALSDLVADGLTEQTASEWIAHRKRKKAPLTPRAWEGIKQAANEAGWPVEAAIVKAMARGWQGFEASWLAKESKPAEVTNRAAEETARFLAEQEANAAEARSPQAVEARKQAMAAIKRVA